MKQIFTTILLTLLLFGCHGVRQVSLSNEQFYSNEKVEDKLDKYNVYFHNGSSTYKLDHPVMRGDSLVGTPVVVDPKTIIETPVTPHELMQSRKDLHVYLDEKAAKNIREKIDKGEKITLSRKEVKEVKVLAKDEDAVFASIGLIILLAIVGILLVYLLILVIAKAADDSTNGSGSGSNSDSGDSGSSNSGDSGGSNSNSGCYIATMVYGSYEAPKVMVLRAFRDQFLTKYTWGKRFIGWYYANSPGFVAKHEKNKILGSCIRGILNVVVWCLKPFFKA